MSLLKRSEESTVGQCVKPGKVGCRNPLDFNLEAAATVVLNSRLRLQSSSEAERAEQEKGEIKEEWRQDWQKNWRQT
uniref:Uncharacterized protein n=1 Tax=Oryza sativa subsp. japonica TaxID=39947 RepID=Q6Z6K5_ORYSJ|nr:hypothetical protein [Oryza sativa Japonica Group]